MTDLTEDGAQPTGGKTARRCDGKNTRTLRFPVSLMPFHVEAGEGDDGRRGRESQKEEHKLKEEPEVRINNTLGSKHHNTYMETKQ